MNGPCDLAGRRLGHRLRPRFLNELIEIDARLGQRGSSHPRERQQVVDELSHPLRGLRDGVEISSRRVIEPGSDPPVQQGDEAGHVAQRRTQSWDTE